jgi:hypothetical protein
MGRLLPGQPGQNRLNQPRPIQAKEEDMADDTCPHEGCNCKLEEGKQYCSDYCEKHATHEGHVAHDCGCGHPGCSH